MSRVCDSLSTSFEFLTFPCIARSGKIAACVAWLVMAVVGIGSSRSLAQSITPTSQPSPPASGELLEPAGVDPALWHDMLDIDARARSITHLSCDFQQQKITPMLKKPLISRGHVRVIGAIMRQDTVDPHPSSLLIDAHQLRIYYPSDQTLEIYDLSSQLGPLAASPLPRLSVLEQYFKFQKTPVSQLDSSARESDVLALKLTPADPALSQYVDEVLVLLDRQHGYITKVQWTDADAEKTVIDFSAIKTYANFTAADLDLKLPSGVKTVHPLGGDPGPTTQRSSP